MDKQKIELKRNEIDNVDKKIVDLLNERLSLVQDIGKIKESTGENYYDPSRELKVLDKVISSSSGLIKDSSLKSIFREIISASISLEKDLNIAYLGPEATFTHQAVMKKFGSSLKACSMKTIYDVFTAVESCECHYGVVPIENSTEGIVFHSIDQLVESDLKICSQIFLPIEHCLISNAKTIEEISEVYSKDQALGQCRDWLRRNIPTAKLTEVSSTLSAVQKLNENPKIALIASAIAAEMYNLPILKKGVQDKLDNVTRFLVIGKNNVKSSGAGKDKTSLVFSLNDESGALEKALMPFAKRNINLSKIESRPSRKKAWDYFFFIDIIGHYEDSSVKDAIHELEKSSPFVKWLGSYPKN